MKITPRMYARALLVSLEKEEQPAHLIKNFLVFLQRKKQLRLLPKIVSSFEEQWAAANQTIKMKVSYPAAFKESADHLVQGLERALGKKIDAEAIASDELLGGFRLLYGDTLIDASIQGQLQRLSAGFSSHT